MSGRMEMPCFSFFRQNFILKMKLTRYSNKFENTIRKQIKRTIDDILLLFYQNKTRSVVQKKDKKSPFFFVVMT